MALFVPYNEAMLLGQGFDSFLQSPRIHNAVIFGDQERTATNRAEDESKSVPQEVSFSYRVIEKISDLVRDMSISPALCIKSGVIRKSHTSLLINDARLMDSDLTVVISVKVVNHDGEKRNGEIYGSFQAPKFESEKQKLDSQRFFELYGDSYVADFVEGGELHGIVSMKVENGQRISEVKEAITRYIDASTNVANKADSFRAGETLGANGLNTVLTRAETMVSVNWCGGGLIKPDGEEWSLQSLLGAALSFPSRVAGCPTRTWAILRKYDHKRSFTDWAVKNFIKVPNFTGFEESTFDLLDSFMEWKSNIRKLEAVIADPLKFKRGTGEKGIYTDIESLIQARKEFRVEIEKLKDVVDVINSNPFEKPLIADLESPEVWAARLPVLRSENDLLGPEAAKQDPELLSRLLKIVPPADKPAPPPPRLCFPEAIAEMLEPEKNFVTSEENIKRYAADYRFDRVVPQTLIGGASFNDVLACGTTLQWPSAVTFCFSMCNGISYEVLGRVVVEYPNNFPPALGHGSGIFSTLRISLKPGDKIVRLRIQLGVRSKTDQPAANKSGGVSFIEVFTANSGPKDAAGAIGKEDLKRSAWAFYPFDETTGLKGFWGRSGGIVDKIGPIWGK